MSTVSDPVISIAAVDRRNGVHKTPAAQQNDGGLWRATDPLGSLAQAEAGGAVQQTMADFGVQPLYLPFYSSFLQAWIAREGALWREPFSTT